MKQNDWYFADNILKYIFLKENLYILIWISSNFVPEDLWIMTQFTDAYICITMPHIHHQGLQLDVTGYYQSGTKPNLVAKIWPPNLVTICAWLPKLVANVNSNVHHLVDIGLAVGSFFKWLPITVAHTCKLDTIWVVYISRIGNGFIQVQSPLTHYALWNFTSSGAGHFSELTGAHT